jgi:hypothetical protein
VPSPNKRNNIGGYKDVFVQASTLGEASAQMYFAGGVFRRRRADVAHRKEQLCWAKRSPVGMWIAAQIINSELILFAFFPRNSKDRADVQTPLT